MAEGTVNEVLSSSFYNRSVRVRKLLFDSFCQLQWAEFVKSLSDDEQQEALMLAMELNESFPRHFEALAMEETGGSVGYP